MCNVKVQLAIIFLFLGHTTAQDADCNFYRDIIPGSTYYVYSKNYSNPYRPGTQCRWILKSPTNYVCRLDCPDIDLPKIESNCVDRFVVSLTGDPQLNSANFYCGRGTLYGIESVGQQLSLALLVSNNSPGGKLYCEVNAVRVSTPTPPPTTCNCGYRKMNRIVGGTSTKPNEFTMMAGIIYVRPNIEESSIKCGGVIITTKHILTAAHCVDQKPVSMLAVVVGEHDVSTGSDSNYTQGFRVASYVIHPQFNESNLDNDIAIVNLQGTITFSDSVGPVCLPFKYASSSFAGETLTMLGWGTQFPGGPTSKVLQMVNVTVTTQAQCQSLYPNLKSTQLCTYTPGKDACQDDSGGPALKTDPNNARLYIVGIISYGRFCASQGWPGVNTRVTSFMQFITTYAPYDYCKI